MARFSRNGSILFVAWVAAALIQGCAARMDSSTQDGKAAILDAARAALNHEECDTAVNLIEGVYNSAYTDNEVRSLRASAYGCLGGIPNLFSLVGKFPSERFEAVPTEGSYFWRTVAKLFYNADTDVLDFRINALMSAADANLAQIKPGYYVQTVNAFNIDSDNLGSTLVTDRTDDGNFYQIFVSMAAIGALEDRYSAPDTTSWKRTAKVGATLVNPSGWELPTAVAGDGCLYASSILNMVDAIVQLEPVLKGSVKTAATYLKDFKPLLDLACNDGCFTICGLPGCTASRCPKTLRNYASCTGTPADENSCAAAGIAKWVNSDADMGWVP